VGYGTTSSSQDEQFVTHEMMFSLLKILCDVLPAVQLNVDVLLQDFFDTFVMSSRLSSKMWTLCRMISGHICDVRAAVQRNVEVFHRILRPICDDIDDFWTSVMTNRLLSKRGCFAA
jgi:hypothetical protein